MIFACPLKDLKPGESLSVQAVVRFTPDPDLPSWTEVSTGLQWRAGAVEGGPWEIDSSDNASSVGLVFCSEKRPSPVEGCKTAG